MAAVIENGNGNVPAKEDILFERPAHRQQKFYTTLTYFGLQNNIILAATYQNKESDAKLSQEQIYAALRKVVRQHPQLGMVYYRRPEGTKHRVWTGFLKRINLDNHVEFVSTPEEEDLDVTIEKEHNIWFEGVSRPPWKIVVVNLRQVLFVWDHTLADGRSAQVFHESFLGALNTVTDDVSDEKIVEISIDKPLEEDFMDRCATKLSILWTIYNLIRFNLMYLMFRGKNLLFHDAAGPRRELDYANPEKEEKRTITRLQTYRIDPATMQKCLQACRKHNTSFTGLLHTLIKVTLAADIYPTAKFNMSATVVDCRHDFRDLSDDDYHRMYNASSCISSFDLLDSFRQAGQPKQIPDSKESISVDPALAWKLSAKHKALVVHDVEHGKKHIHAVQGIRLTSDLDEDFVPQFAPGLRTFQQNSFTLSNIGAFKLDPEYVGVGPWTISGMELSAGATGGGYSVDLVINVAGVHGQGTVVRFMYEEDHLKADMVRMVLEGVKSRLEQLLD